ncbi:MFS family permease [Devosia sp. UYZn731]|uniref:MFS transporter n=1 Tax=Devosia sp. UYZn731 TaxID=3156345 RepID=UPI00339AD906
MSAQDSTSPLPKSGDWGDLFTGNNGIFSIALGGSVALHALNIYIATTIMPSAIREISGLDYYAWTTTLFVVASILGAALSASLMVRAGARGAYTIAALIFGIGTLCCALAPTMPIMLFGRLVQGLGGGFLYALAYGVIRLIFPEQLWGRAIGLISATWGIATLIGPAIGGIFAEIDAWRMAFWSLIPFAVLFAGMAFVTLPKRGTDTDKPTRLPLMQLLLLSAATLALSLGSLAKTPIWSLVSAGGAIVVIALLLAVELRAQTRIVPKNTFARGSRLGQLYGAIALLVIGMQPEIFVPYLLQVLHGQSPLIAGYLAALMAIGWTLGSISSGNWQGAAASRVFVLGPALGLAGLCLLAIFLPKQSAGDWMVLGPICLGLIAVGFGIGMAWPHLVTAVFQSAPVAEQELAAGAVTTVQLFATALGAAAAGTIANLAGIANPGGVDGAANAALWLFATFAVAPLFGILIAKRAT